MLLYASAFTASFLRGAFCLDGACRIRHWLAAPKSWARLRWPSPITRRHVRRDRLIVLQGRGHQAHHRLRIYVAPAPRF